MELTTDDSNDLFVDFSSVEEDIPHNKQERKEHIINYDRDTREKYRVLRLRKMDPIAYVELPDEVAFKFKYKWDPYTGERQEEDPNGPLCFDPDLLIKFFHTKRLTKLWVNPVDEHNGHYQGYYDSGVGQGEDFHLIGRGSHPEWYIFRLPIIDCYLTTDHNKQFITFGPKLTDEEITEIERLAQLRKNNYKNMFAHNRPSLTLMKKLYDIAICPRPSIQNLLVKSENKKQESISAEELQEYFNRANRDAVDQLVTMRG